MAEAVIATFGVALDAENCLLYLCSQGLSSARIVKDDGGGNLPSLGAVTGYAVLVDDGELSRAIELIREYSPSEFHIDKSQPRKTSQVFWILVVVIISISSGVLGYYFGRYGASRTVSLSVDRNWDTINDVEWVLDAKGNVIENKRDRNYDGRMDEIVHYKNGAVSLWLRDDNFDNDFEVRTVGSDLGLVYSRRQILGSDRITGETTYFKHEMPDYSVYWGPFGQEVGRTQYRGWEPISISRISTDSAISRTYEIDEMGLPKGLQ